jgi:hypothetical protein
MKIHLKQITPEGLHIEGEDRSVDLDLGGEDYLKCLGPVQYSLEVAGFLQQEPSGSTWSWSASGASKNSNIH